MGTACTARQDGHAPCGRLVRASARARRHTQAPKSGDTQAHASVRNAPSRRCSRLSPSRPSLVICLPHATLQCSACPLRRPSPLSLLVPPSQTSASLCPGATSRLRFGTWAFLCSRAREKQ
eukprot:3498272-Pleurochrysis_carterae.AAC.4